MGIISISNNGKNDMIVSGRLIPPGETAHFEENVVPLALRPAAAPQVPVAEPPDPLHQLQCKSVKTVKDALPTLKEFKLVELCRLEESSEKPRSTLIAAIGEERLRRANVSARNLTGEKSEEH